MLAVHRPNRTRATTLVHRIVCRHTDPSRANAPATATVTRTIKAKIRMVMNLAKVLEKGQIWTRDGTLTDHQMIRKRGPVAESPELRWQEEVHVSFAGVWLLNS